MSDINNSRYSNILVHTDQALDAQDSVYGMWTEVASDVLELGEAVVWFMLTRKKDGRELTANRKLTSMKATDPDGHKQAKVDAKVIRDIIVTQTKARGSDNPRMNVSRVVDKAAEMIGMPKPQTAGTGKGGTTSYDKVAEACRMLKNHLEKTEPSQCLELKDAWAGFEEAAINDGILKDE